MPKKILVVDDERHVVRLAQVNLERAGYEVITAFDGKDAIEKVELEHPALVVLDVTLPDMDGFEVLQNLRNNQATRDVPVIMLATIGADQDLFRWSGGVVCHLPKPFNPMELISFVKRIFAYREGSETNTATVKPLADGSVKPVSWWIKAIKRLFY